MCDLTVGSDELPGLPGLAEEYERLTGDRYGAGLWISTLPGALMWKPKREALSRFNLYRAPPWSWASMDGILAMSIAKNTEPGKGEDVECVSHRIKLRNSRAPFGEVAESVVTVKGKLIKARMTYDEPKRITVDISN